MGHFGRNTLIFDAPVYIAATGTVVGEKENLGKLAGTFDKVVNKNTVAKETWEDKEVQLQREAISIALGKSGLAKENVNFLLGGDLINQLTITNLIAEEFAIPFFGLYNACATMAESMILSSLLLSHGYGSHGIAVASSHNATSERQYRNPTELGAQRPQTAQWTVTGAGAMLLSNKIKGIRVVGGTVGSVLSMGIKDADQMGAAMAPAVSQTLVEHFKNTHTSPQDYDCIISGDLGYHGHKILMALLENQGYKADARFLDGGMELYKDDQDTHSGGSGAGCSAIVWPALVFNRINNGTYKKVLLAGSGALLSPTMVQQGNDIPAICHVVSLDGGALTCG